MAEGDMYRSQVLLGTRHSAVKLKIDRTNYGNEAILWTQKSFPLLLGGWDWGFGIGSLQDLDRVLLKSRN